MQRSIRNTLLGTSLAVAVTIGAAAGLRNETPAPTPTEPVAVPAALGAVPVPDDLPGLILSLESRVAELPGDYVAWANLALAHVDQGRVDGDRSRYDTADDAIAASFAAEPDDNFLAYAARAATAAARHDFAAAISAAEAGLDINPSSPVLLGIASDALVQLGRYDEGLAAADRMAELQPGTGSFARVSYSHQLSGDLVEAERVMQRAHDIAYTDSDRAYAQVQLGEFDLARGDNAEGLDHHLAALALQPENVGALAGKAHALRLLGQTQTSSEVYEQLVEQAPLVDFIVEYAAHASDTGDTARAEELLDRARELHAADLAAGFEPDAGVIEFEATYGDLETALAMGEELVERQPFFEVHEAYAFALLQAGRVDEAAAALAPALELGLDDPDLDALAEEIAAS